MAEFQIVEEQGTRWVRALLQDETVRCEAAALCYMRGQITMRSRVPSLGGWVRASLSEEAAVRPYFTGTGELVLESSLGGFHVFELGGQAWVLDSGSYWASDGSVQLSVTRERAWTSYMNGEGFIDFQTRVAGPGRVVLAASGPVEEMVLAGDEVAVDGRYVIARTEGVRFRLRRPTKSWLGSKLSGEGRLRVYQGHGRVLMSSTPYWRMKLAGAVPGF